jgi:hypothetical protein
VPTRDLLLDRAMMGDGVIDIALIRGWVDAAGYDGFCEVEIFSEADWWRRPAEEVVAACIVPPPEPRLKEQPCHHNNPHCHARTCCGHP